MKPSPTNNHRFDPTICVLGCRTPNPHQTLNHRGTRFETNSKEASITLNLIPQEHHFAPQTLATSLNPKSESNPHPLSYQIHVILYPYGTQASLSSKFQTRKTRQIRQQPYSPPTNPIHELTQQLM